VLRRASPLLIALTVALVASGCGSKSSGSGLDSALSYVPKNAPLVVAIDTNPDGGQWQQVNKLIGKFPFGGEVKQQFKSAFSGRSGIDYDKDIKPLLGDDIVVAVTSTAGGATPFVVAWHVKDEGAAKKLIQRNSKKAGSIDGNDVYGTNGTNLSVVKDGTWILSDNLVDLQAAVKRAGGDHLTEQDFTDRLGNLDKDSLVRVAGDAQALNAGSSGALLHNLKFLQSQKDFGATLRAEPDGVELAFENQTDSDIPQADLPLATGSDSVPVVRRAGEIGIGLRNPAHTIAFYESVFKTAAPSMYTSFLKGKAKAQKQLGVDIDRDLVGQLTGNAAISVSLTGDFAVRADLRDPAAATATLKKVAPRIVKLAKGKSVGLSTPKNGQGFYALAQANGKKVVFGVVGKTFVAASDAARAAQFAGQSPSVVPGAKGSFVIATDARALANAIAARQGQGTAAQLVTGALGDLIGWVDTESNGVTGSFKLFVK
jgi:hypothetical protein